ncbi:MULTISPECIES: O-antigen ligase family protein [Colwellia]|uniref:O-antigen polymerase n=1 Tax=Colwellia marinimaniae TaxID=1513592 RepID=A0ABQ0MX65_9GAMM|nr:MULTISPECIES: O-antigen ligase family protein [Colwellia]GAW96963.1 hypothetical protein MTCD1_02586 [Colwellia marinimaniae]
MFFQQQKLSSIFFFSCFILLPFFDALNGYLVVNKIINTAGLFSPSQLGRLFFSMLLLYIIHKRKLGVLPLFIIFYLFFVEVVSGISHQSPYGVFYGLMYSYKIAYLILLVIVLSSYLKEPKDVWQLGQYLTYNLLIISFLLWFSTITGIGNSTYNAGFGTKSFFSSGNGLGLYLGIGCLFLLGLKHYGLFDVSTKRLLLIAFSIALIGSKTALILCLVNLMIICLLSKHRNIIIALFFILLILLLPKIISLLSIVFDVILFRLERSDNIFIYLGSGRLEYVADAFSQYLNSAPSIIRHFIGAGAFTSFQNPSDVVHFDTLETDLFDLFFMYGFLSVLYFSTLIIFVLYQLRVYKIFLLGMLLLSLHSVIAGHVLFNGMSSVCFVLFICISGYLSKTRKIHDKINA